MMNCGDILKIDFLDCIGKNSLPVNNSIWFFLFLIFQLRTFLIQFVAILLCMQVLKCKSSINFIEVTKYRTYNLFYLQIYTFLAYYLEVF